MIVRYPDAKRQPHIESEIYYACGHATRHVLFQEVYHDHQGHFLYFPNGNLRTNQTL